MIETARVAMPLLSPGQNGKEIFHNEALLVVDALLCPVVQTGPTSTPPVSPAEGQCFAVGSGATGEWIGQEGSLAVWTDGGWRTIGVPEGSSFRIRDSGNDVVRTATGWEIGVVRADEIRIGGNSVVGSQQAAIAAVSGGGVIDVQARTTIGQILTALRAHGLIAS